MVLLLCTRILLALMSTLESAAIVEDLAACRHTIMCNAELVEIRDTLEGKPEDLLGLDDWDVLLHQFEQMRVDVVEGKHTLLGYCVDWQTNVVAVGHCAIDCCADSPVLWYLLKNKVTTPITAMLSVRLFSLREPEQYTWLDRHIQGVCPCPGAYSGWYMCGLRFPLYLCSLHL